MSRPTWPQVWVVRWHQIGGRPVHRFYVAGWYAHARAKTLAMAGYDVELYQTRATWTRERR